MADESRATYHKFVKTTPKPKATKKSSGELVGPPPPLEAWAEVVAAGGAIEVEDGAMVLAEVEWEPGQSERLRLFVSQLKAADLVLSPARSELPLGRDVRLSFNYFNYCMGVMAGWFQHFVRMNLVFFVSEAVGCGVSFACMKAK